MKLIFDFLIKKFVKNYNDVTSEKVREEYGWLGGTVGIIINSTILAIELAIGLFLNSIAVMADAVHNLTDALSSLVTIISFKLANRPADDEHPFGHGRIEYLTALLFSAAIFFVGYEFVRNSINRILHPVNIPFNLISFIMMLIALPLQIFLNRFTNYLGKKIDSSALKASAVESFTDILVLSMVVLSLLITRFTSFPIDGYVGIIVSLFILHSGYELAKETLDTILGKAPDKKMVQDITSAILSYPYIKGVHDLVIHNYGPGRYMASAHAEVPYDVPIMELHDIIDKAEKEVGELLNIYLVIHMDPVKTDSPEVIILKEKINHSLTEIQGIESMHDFRVVGDGEEKTLLFDIVIDKSKNNENDKQSIIKQIEEQVKKIYPKYRCIITIDLDYN